MTRWTEKQLEEYSKHSIPYRKFDPSALIDSKNDRSTPTFCSVALSEPEGEELESTIQKRVKLWCEIHGYPCLSFPRTKAVVRYLPAGWPDMVCILPNKVFFIEFKSKKGRKSKEQINMFLQFKSLGHEIYEIKTFKRFLEVTK